MRRSAYAEGFAEEFKILTELTREVLISRWVGLYGGAPPPRTSRSLMIRAVAYKMQERAFGGLSRSTRRVLADKDPSGTGLPPAGARPGTVLLREWRGDTHQVTVVEGGVLYRGKQHRSLSEVARLITGSRWSGPAFFGLKVKGPRREHDAA